MHFCAAGKEGLLLGLLVRLQAEILVPAEVDAEVRRKAHSKYPDASAPWGRFVANDRVTVLDELTLDNPAQDAVREKVARLRGMSSGLALGTRKDLGEHVVVGHGALLKASGRQVYVLMDDTGGQHLARREGLQVIDIERLLLLGHAAKLPALATKQSVRAVYDALRPHGAGLPSWRQSRLQRELR